MNHLIFGDLHLKINNLNLATEVLSWIEKQVAIIKPDAAFYLGDVFHTHAVIRSEILTIFYDHIVRVSNMVKTYYILGNHDLSTAASSKYHSLHSFKNIPNLTIVDSYTVEQGISMIPYVHNMDDFPKIDTDITYCHQTFLGANYGHIIADSGVNAAHIKGIILSGHIHKKQQLGNVYYVGSVFSQDMNDLNEIKGITLFNTDTFAQQFIEAPFPKWKSVGLTYDKDIHKNILSNINEEDNWIIQLEGNQSDIVKYISSSKYKELLTKYKIQIKPIYLDKAKAKYSIKSKTLSDIVVEYFDKVYTGDIDKDLLKKRAVEILRTT